MRGRGMRNLLMPVAVVAAALVPGPSADAARLCREIRLPVALADGRPATYEVAGTLCTPDANATGTVQVLVHGFSLSRVYFDPPYAPERYSYVRAANAAGYSTLAIDRIGVGTSDDPPATEVTTDSNAFVVHQVVEAVRAGRATGTPVARVVLVAHSYGTEVAAIAAGRHGGVDALVGTGFLHPGFDPPGAMSLIGSTYPAQADPAFSSAGLPPGYVTTLPGYRRNFYDPGNVDPAVVAMDERTKQTGTYGEIVTFGQYYQPGSVAGVAVPVLVVVGEHDPYFCNEFLSCSGPGALVERERDWFSAVPCLEAFVQAGAGHNISLELNNRDAWAAQLDFLDRHVGPSGAPKRPGGCLLAG